MTDKTQTLAKQMGVTPRDIESLLDMVANSIEQDGARDIMKLMTEEERVDFVNAYIQAEVKKFNDFCVTLLTNTEKRSAFDLYLLNQLRD